MFKYNSTAQNVAEYQWHTARKNCQFTYHPSLQTIKTIIFDRLEIGVIGGRITCGGQVKNGDHNVAF